MSRKFRIPSLIEAVMLGLLALGAASCATGDRPLSGSSSDLVGAGGPQDDVARQIYHPGSGTDW